MRRSKLTKRLVESLSATKGELVVFDTEARGLAVRVRATGGKSFVCMYRPAGRPLRRMTLGHFPTISVERARKMAGDIQTAVSHGKDPAAVRQEGRRATKLADFGEKYLELHARAHKKPSSAEIDRHHLMGTIIPSLGAHTPLVDVTNARVTRLHRSLHETPVKANRIVALLSHMYTMAKRWGDVPETFTSPTSGVKRNREGKREKYLDSDDMRRLAKALADLESLPERPTKDEEEEAKSKKAAKGKGKGKKTREGGEAANGPTYKRGEPRECAACGKTFSPKNISGPEPRACSPECVRKLRDATPTFAVMPAQTNALRLLLLTGARLREVTNLRWREVDFERSCLRLADSKTGAKTIPLAAPALDLLRGLSREVGNEHVFPGMRAGRPIDGDALRKVFGRACAAAKIEGARMHDLRHTFASVGAGLNLGLPVIGSLLGHSQSATTQRYAHVANTPAHAAANEIASVVADALGLKTATAAKQKAANGSRPATVEPLATGTDDAATAGSPPAAQIVEVPAKHGREKSA